MAKQLIPVAQAIDVVNTSDDTGRLIATAYDPETGEQDYLVVLYDGDRGPLWMPASMIDSAYPKSF